MKTAIVKALFKNKGTEEDAQFYRPLSILSVVSKVFERAVTDQIVEYLEAENLLFANQHAYRKFHSTTTSLTQLTELIHEEIEKGNIIGIASLDLSKAFDRINRNDILSSLIAKGVSHKWTKMILESHRETKIINKMEGKMGSWYTNNIGIYQGNPLSGLIFLIIYIMKITVGIQ